MASRFSALAAGLAAFLAMGCLPPFPAIAAAGKHCATKRQLGATCLNSWLDTSPRRPAHERQRNVFPYPPGAARRPHNPARASVPQLSPRLRARRSPRFDFEPRPERCRKGERLSASGDCVASRGLPEALIRKPDASTQETLRQIGIPAIPDVPPVATLRSSKSRKR